MKSNAKRLIIILIAAFVCMLEVANAFYDPGLQRWINRDPFGDISGFPLMTTSIAPSVESDDGEGMTDGQFFDAWIDINRNLYGAMGNNPVNVIDPLGLAELPCGGGPGSMNPANLEALDVRAAGEIARAAAERVKQQVIKATQTMIKQAAKDGPKSLQKSIRSFDKQITKHLKKIADNPNSPAVNHWKNEIANWQRLKDAADKVLKVCPKE